MNQPNYTGPVCPCCRSPLRCLRRQVSFGTILSVCDCRHPWHAEEEPK